MARQMSLQNYRLPQVDVRLILKESSVLYSTSPIDSPHAAVRIMAEVLKDMDREMVCVVNMDTHNHPINFNVVSIGGTNQAYVPIQNIFKAAILSNSVSILLLHTHPSGNVQPSIEDDHITRKLAHACALMDIELIDHIIVGSVTGDIYSYQSSKPTLLRPKADVLFSGIAEEPIPEYGGTATMNSVSFEEFSDWIGQALKKELEGRGIQGDIHYEDMRKIGSSYHGMSIYQGDSTVSPVFNLDSLYNDYLHERPIQVERMADYVENAIGMSNIKEGLVDYEHVKDSLFIRLSNGDYNRDLLPDCLQKTRICTVSSNGSKIRKPMIRRQISILL